MNAKRRILIFSLFLFTASLGTVHAAALDTNRIERITGLKGTWNASEGVFKVTSPRTDLPVSVDGWRMPPFMGLTTWAGFIEGKKAEAMVAGDLVLFEVVDGDFAVLEDELQPVLKSLRAAGVNIVPIHRHMTHENPRILFLHYWGKGKAAELAKAVKSALDTQAK